MYRRRRVDMKATEYLKICEIGQTYVVIQSKTIILTLYHRNIIEIPYFSIFLNVVCTRGMVKYALRNQYYFIL